MTETIMPKQASPTASEYVSDNFKHSDRIAVLVLNRNLGETTQRITTAQKAASPEFQAWLRYKNANGADIYVGMNPLKQDASTRTKGDIEAIRHVYVDLDHGGSAALEEIKNSDLVPQPNYVLNTSPEKFQVVWKVEGMTLEEAEALQHAMAKGLFRPHYVAWSEQKKIECSGPQYLRNVIQIITETGLRIYRELAPMSKDQVDLQNAVVWIPDSKTPNGISEVPLTSLAIEAFKSQMAISGDGPFLFPSHRIPIQHQTTFKTVWRKTLQRAKVPYFRIYDLRSTYATRLSAGGVADEWVTQMLRQSDAQVFKKYSQMKLQMKREALEKLNRRANEMEAVTANTLITAPICTVTVQ